MNEKYFDSDVEIKWLTMRHNPLACSWLDGLDLLCVAV
jgi:hypothetical protein